METITATEAAKLLSDFLNRVEYRGESFRITRAGKPVATLGPVEREKTGKLRGLVELVRRAQPDPAFADDLERIQAEQPRLTEEPWRS